MGRARIATVEPPSGGGHADVHPRGGLVYPASTALDQVEILDRPGARHLGSLAGCAEGSGVLSCGHAVATAARGSGELLVRDGATGELLRRFRVGPSPNGLAWDPDRSRLLVADTSEHNVRLVDLEGGATSTLARSPVVPAGRSTTRAQAAST